MTEYGYSVEIAEGYDEAVMRTRLALRAEGFSILTEAHVGDVFGPEAGAERQYLIMGAWGSAASAALDDQRVQVGFHLPCNVVVQEVGRSAVVAALDPGDTIDPGDAESGRAADDARSALKRALTKVATSG